MRMTRCPVLILISGDVQDATTLLAKYIGSSNLMGRMAKAIESFAGLKIQTMVLTPFSFLYSVVLAHKMIETCWSYFLVGLAFFAIPFTFCNFLVFSF
jgi:hypothetical protein